MYAREDWVGYAGGLGLAVFLMSIVPSVVHRAAVAAQGGRAHKVFFTAWVVVSVLDFVSTMTVAYAFVRRILSRPLFQGIDDSHRCPEPKFSGNELTCESD